MVSRQSWWSLASRMAAINFCLFGQIRLGDCRAFCRQRNHVTLFRWLWPHIDTLQIIPSMDYYYYLFREITTSHSQSSQPSIIKSICFISLLFQIKGTSQITIDFGDMIRNIIGALVTWLAQRELIRFRQGRTGYYLQDCDVFVSLFVIQHLWLF